MINAPLAQSQVSKVHISKVLPNLCKYGLADAANAELIIQLTVQSITKLMLVLTKAKRTMTVVKYVDAFSSALISKLLKKR